jgi:hypothetical protein
MLFQTRVLIEKAWEYLIVNPHLHEFRSKGQFVSACKGLAEVSGDGRQSYLCCIDPDEPFREGNLTIVNVHRNIRGFDDVNWPAIEGGIEEMEASHDL